MDAYRGYRQPNVSEYQMFATADDIAPNARLDAAGEGYPVLKNGRVLGSPLSLNTLSKPTLFDEKNDSSLTIYWKNDALKQYRPYIHDGIRLLSGGMTLSTGAAINFSGVGVIASPLMIGTGINEVVAASSSLYNRWNGIDAEGLNLMRDGLDVIYPGKGDAAYNALAFGANAISLFAKVPYKGYFNDSINGGQAIFGTKVMRWDNPKGVPVLKINLSPIASKAILVSGVATKGEAVYESAKSGK